MLRFRGPWQRSLRHEKEPVDWRKFALGVAVAVLMTAVEMVGFNRGMRRHAFDSNYRGAIQVSLIDETALLDIVEPPLPEPDPFPLRQSRVRIQTPKTPPAPPPKVARDENSNEMQGRLGEGGSAARIFSPDGRVRLPEGTAAAPKVAGTPQQQRREQWEELQQRGENPLDCQRTRFAQAFRKDQSIGDSVAGKYLKYIGLANSAAIGDRLQQRESRASDGCDPPKR